MTTNSNPNLQTIRSIGKGQRLIESATAAIVATVPEGFDPNKRGAVANLVHTWAGFPNAADRPAVTTGGKGKQVATDYGRGHDTLTKAVKRALAGDKDQTTPDYLALVRQAAETARTKGNVMPDEIVKAIAAWSESLLTSDK